MSPDYIFAMSPLTFFFLSPTFLIIYQTDRELVAGQRVGANACARFWRVFAQASARAVGRPLQPNAAHAQVNKEDDWKLTGNRSKIDCLLHSTTSLQVGVSASNGAPAAAVDRGKGVAGNFLNNNKQQQAPQLAHRLLLCSL